MEYVNDQDQVITSEEEDLMDELYEVLHRAWIGWVRQQPETLREDYGKNQTTGLNALTYLSAYLLIDAICPSLFDGDNFDQKAATGEVAKCHDRIVMAVYQDVVPALREDLERMGLNCDGAEVIRKVRPPNRRHRRSGFLTRCK